MRAAPTASTNTRVTPSSDSYLARFRQRVIHDALTEATAACWERRALAFEVAAPRPGDYHGHATAQELAERRQRCMDAAIACRAHASLWLGAKPEPTGDDVRAVLEEAW